MEHQNSAGVCNGATRAKQKCSTENAEPYEGCTNKPGNVQDAWSVIVTSVSGLHAHKGKPSMRWPTCSKAISRLFPRPYPNLLTSKFRGNKKELRLVQRGSLQARTHKASVLGSTPLNALLFFRTTNFYHKGRVCVVQFSICRARRALVLLLYGEV